MPKRNTLIPIRDKIAILDKSYQRLESFIRKRLFDFTVYDENKAKKLKTEIFEKIARQDKINRVWVGLNIPLAYNQAASIAKKRLGKIKAKVKKKRFDLVSSQSKKNGTLQMISYMDAANKKIKETVTQYFSLLKKANKKAVSLQNYQLQNLVDNQEILKGTDEIIKASIIPVERITKAGFPYMAIPSRKEVQRDINGLFEKTFGDFQFISITMKNGKIRNYKPNVYIEMLARTRLRDIQTQAVKDRCREYQNDLVQVSTHDDPCPVCEVFQGQVYSLSGNDSTYPKFDINFPIHPNCEHNINPTSKEAIAIEKEFGKVFPEPYYGSVEDTIKAVRMAKAEAAKKVKAKPIKILEEKLKTETLLAKSQIEESLYKLGIKNVDLTDINDTKVLSELSAQLTKLIKSEGYKNNIKGIWNYSNGSIAKASRKLIKLNRKYFDNYAKFLKALKHDIEKGFHPLMDESEMIKSIITHEFVHTLTIDEIYSKKGLFKELHYLRSEYKKALYAWKGNVLKECPAFISDYAAESLVEFTAEAFVMYKHSSAPSPFAVKVGKLIDAKYKKGGIK